MIRHSSLFRHFFSGLTSLALLLFIAQGAEALSVRMSLAELSGEADSIIVGKVVSSESQWNEERTNIYTTVTVVVEDRIKGSSKQNLVTIIVPGGTVDGITEVVSETPAFVPGEKAVLFLNELSSEMAPLDLVSPNIYDLVGNHQGKLEIPETSDQELKEKRSDSVAGPDYKSASFEPESDSPSSSEHYQFVLLGIRWYGSFPRVPYYINASSTNNAHVRAAAETWSNAGANFAFHYAGTHTRSGRAAYNGRNEIMWYDLGTNNILGLATIWYAGNRILEADMVFNTRFAWSTSLPPPFRHHDVQTVALHEFGHWVGLDHPPVFESIMYERYKGVQRQLHSSDIAAIRYIYGTSGPTVANDNFADRILIEGVRGHVTGSNVNATMEPGEPRHAGTHCDSSVWWEWVAPANGRVVFDTFGSSFDTVLAVYTGSSLSSLSEVASNDDYGLGRQSRVQFDVTSGRSYKIAVAGWGQSSGEINLNWDLTPASCTVSAPAKPGGPDNGHPGETYRFTVQNAACTQGHPVEYRFDWGDGSFSDWIADNSAEYSWHNSGTYQVRAKARCSVDRTKESSWSTARTVTIAKKQFTLTITTEGMGTTVPESGSHTFDQGQTVELTAIAAEGWQFERWLIDTREEETSALTVTMDQDQTAKAVFSKKPVEYTLTISLEGRGSTTPAEGVHNYTEGTAVILSAEPDEGWQFSKWLIDGEEYLEAVRTVLVDKNTSALAVFTEKDKEIADDPPVNYYTLTLSIQGQGQTEPQGGVYSYAEGEEIILTATPSDNWEFVFWLCADEEFFDRSISIIISGDIEVTAVFNEITEPEPVEDPQPDTQPEPDSPPDPQPEEEPDPEPGQEPETETEPVPEPDPDPNAEPQPGPVNDPSPPLPPAGSAPPATSSPPHPIHYGLSMAVTGGGTTIPAPGAHDYEEGLDVKVSAKPEEGWRFEKWIINGLTVTDSNTSISMTESKTVTAYFSRIKKGDITGSGNITVNDVVLVAQYSLGLANLTENQINNADVNGDGVVNVLDISLLMRYTLGLIDSLPE